MNWRGAARWLVRLRSALLLPPFSPVNIQVADSPQCMVQFADLGRESQPFVLHSREGVALGEYGGNAGSTVRVLQRVPDVARNQIGISFASSLLEAAPASSSESQDSGKRSFRN